MRICYLVGSIKKIGDDEICYHVTRIVLPLIKICVQGIYMSDIQILIKTGRHI